MSALREMFDRALKEFLKEERALIASNAAERAWCGRLAMKLERGIEQQHLQGYYADVDYNRKQNGRLKTIKSGNEKVIVIVTDIIVHSRGELAPRDNLIAIEMKKFKRPRAEKALDRERLAILTTPPERNEIYSADGGVTHPEHVCGYELGVFLEIDPTLMKYSLELFELGSVTGFVSGSF
ncbi:hypothetical protein GFL49_05025 [Rhizobium leguminosarum bv. viciae]|nr:hypothetical protein [Rhizobium leguminosarum bv. viciae]